jgi:DNA-binding beta-propeller fold protein YncE
MRRVLPFCLLVCLPIAAQVAPIPTSTELPSSPFAIKKNWIIGGAGSWDYLTIDPAAKRLYIAHDHSVQVVDLDSGAVAGEIAGFHEAHAITLDDTGQYGYVSDGPANAIAVFDRRALRIESTIAIGCAPRSIAFERQSKLVFAICSANAAIPAPASPLRRPLLTSHVIAIDTDSKTVLADMVVAGDYRFAQVTDNGQVYVTVYPANQSSPSQIAKLDGVAIATEAHRRRDADSPKSPSGAVIFDWSRQNPPINLVRFLVPAACRNPQSFAVDHKDGRLFVACDDQQFVVLDSETGALIAKITTGPGDDVVGYDPDHELIYSANGGGYGSLTIIQQDANTDSYAVIQNLPTLARASTLAVDPSTGNVYLVTDYTGVDLTPSSGFGAIKTAPVAGSFRVLVVGH